MNSECLLSILIPTLTTRRPLYQRLQRELSQQIENAGAGAAVEILALSDDGTEPVGSKRNRLIEQSSGGFIVFVDDDDRVSADYVQQILTAIRENPKADCICFGGQITFRGHHPRKLAHSIAFKDWGEHGGRYLRPPCHITPIRREIARRYRFAEIDYSEDVDWAMRISRDGALRHEIIVDAVLYHYASRRFYAWQWLLDLTQPVRHALGLRLVNRLALKRWLSLKF